MDAMEASSLVGYFLTGTTGVVVVALHLLLRIALTMTMTAPSPGRSTILRTRTSPPRAGSKTPKKLVRVLGSEKKLAKSSRRLDWSASQLVWDVKRPDNGATKRARRLVFNLKRSGNSNRILGIFPTKMMKSW